MPSERVAVVGVGYVGLSVACTLAEAGFETIGVDIDIARVQTINAGRSPIVGKEPGLSELLSKVVAEGRLKASSDILACKRMDAYFLCLDSPISQNKRPILDVLRGECVNVGKVMGRDCLVSVESTLPPRTMQDMVIPLLEKNSGMRAGKDFSVVHCPERVMPGRLLYNMRNYSRVIGGLDKRSVERAKHFYSKLTKGELFETDLLSAEICKTAENAYRDVQIAFANEVALICEEAGADAFEVRRLVNTCPFRDMHTPGAGVGGHCLTKDSWLLVSQVKRAGPSVIADARRLNDLMPVHTAGLAEEALVEAERPLKDSRISVMGLAFLRDSDEIRNSPAMAIIDHFADRADVVVHDPFVPEGYRAPLERDLGKALLGSDCAIFVTDHSVYKELDLMSLKEWMRTPVIVDGRNIFDGRRCRDLGFIYKGVGKG
ncbi:MAG: nucleotide sugar dehydrogenase [Methanomassiliicoccales archaeon]|jgi:UDP-N-acetyl-D-mannosaminuronic acid dehydrogenase|nr:nucleotide sugar dehydrogenase [Methanomassiliicoccales archaeon]